MGVETVQTSEPGKDQTLVRIGIARTLQRWRAINTQMRVEVDNSFLFGSMWEEFWIIEGALTQE